MIFQKNAIEGGLDTEPPLCCPATAPGSGARLQGQVFDRDRAGVGRRAGQSDTAGPPSTGTRRATQASSSALPDRGDTPGQMRFFL